MSHSAEQGEPGEPVGLLAWCSRLKLLSPPLPPPLPPAASQVWYILAGQASGRQSASKPVLLPHQLNHCIHLLQRLGLRQLRRIQQQVGCTSGAR